MQDDSIFFTLIGLACILIALLYMVTHPKISLSETDKQQKPVQIMDLPQDTTKAMYDSTYIDTLSINDTLPIYYDEERRP